MLMFLKSKSGDLKIHGVKNCSQRTESGVYVFYLAFVKKFTLSLATEITLIMTHLFGLKLLAFDDALSFEQAFIT